jgi:hypothetical protein
LISSRRPSRCERATPTTWRKRLIDGSDTGQETTRHARTRELKKKPAT